jgi:hypothetical protein
LATLVLVTVAAFAVVTTLWLGADAERRQKELAYLAANEARSVAEIRREEAEQARRDEVQAREREQGEFYLNGIALAESYWRNNNLPLAEQVLEACPVKHRHWEWFYLKRLCGSRGYLEVRVLLHRRRPAAPPPPAAASPTSRHESKVQRVGP